MYTAQVEIVSGVEVENLGADMSAENPGEGPSTSILDLAEEMQDVSVDEQLDMYDPGEGTSSGPQVRSRSSLFRDQKKILDAANHDPIAIGKAHQTVLPNKDAAYVAKRISTDPHLGEPLRKYIKKLDQNLEKMNDEFNRDEDGEKWENPSPIRCLAYMLGFFTCHVQ